LRTDKLIIMVNQPNIYKREHHITNMTLVIVKSQIKEVVKTSQTNVDNVSSDFADKLNEKVTTLINDACARAKENGRKTVMAKDL
jgi:histone H3/H4